MNTVLAIDPGTVTGFACSTGEAGVHSLARKGDHDLTAIQHHGALFRRFSNWLGMRIDGYEPSIVVIEMMVPVTLWVNGRLLVKAEDSQLLIGLRGAAASVCDDRQIMIEEVNQSTWKKWCREKQLPIPESDDHEGAARMMLDWFGAVRLPKLEAA